MSVTVRELYMNSRDKFHLKSLAGEKGYDFNCTWVHMTEDSSVLDFFWGNEMVVSSGYGIKSHEDFMHFLEKLVEKNCTGLILNVGQYIYEVPRDVIDYCVEKDLSLFTMPWEMPMTELVRDWCTQITQSMLGEEKLADSIMHIVHFPEEAGAHKNILAENFTESEGFSMASISIDLEGTDRKILEHRNSLRIHTAMRKYNFSYIVFRNDQNFILFLNQNDLNVTKEVLDTIKKAILLKFPLCHIHMGAGLCVERFEDLSTAYHTATAARRCAILEEKDTVSFQEMNYYRLLFMVPDKSLLESYYTETMAPLLQYGQKNLKADIFIETLFCYLLSDRSLMTASKLLYTHENTVYYRIRKIKEILNCQLETVEEREKYLFAYYCGIITGKCGKL